MGKEARVLGESAGRDDPQGKSDGYLPVVLPVIGLFPSEINATEHRQAPRVLLSMCMYIYLLFLYVLVLYVYII